MPLSIDEQLLPHRNAIDSIDAEILRLLNERAGHAHAIGELKGTGAVYRPEREVAVLRRIQDLNHGPLPDESVTRLFREIMSECLAGRASADDCLFGPEGDIYPASRHQTFRPRRTHHGVYYHRQLLQTS